MPLEHAQQRLAVRAEAMLPLREDHRIVLARGLPALLVAMADGRGVGDGRARAAEPRCPFQHMLVTSFLSLLGFLEAAFSRVAGWGFWRFSCRNRMRLLETGIG
jgi:hypothetical protein